MGKFKEKVTDLAGASVGPVMDIVSTVLFDGTAGVLVPGVGNMILAYKQKRMERRIEQTLEMLVKRQDEFNSAVFALKDENAVKDIKTTYFDMMMDYAIDEPQDEKIQYLMNGYINTAKIQNPKEDVVRSFYDTLRQMNMLDIRVFKLYAFASIIDDSASKVMSDYEIDNSQYRMIQEKLERLGLIYSKSEETRDKNVDAIVSYLNDLSRGKKARLKTTRIIGNGKHYKLSKYGYRFIRFIETEYDEEYKEEEQEETINLDEF